MKTINESCYESLHFDKNSTYNSGGILLYCNGLAGFPKVEPTDPELVELLDTNLGIRGNNVLSQLKTLFLNYSGGPWFVDCINGMIVIHNQDFKDTPRESYTFMGEPGELLKVNISLQDKRTDKKRTSLLNQTQDIFNKAKSALSQYKKQEEANRSLSSKLRDQTLGQIYDPVTKKPIGEVHYNPEGLLAENAPNVSKADRIEVGMAVTGAASRRLAANIKAKGIMARDVKNLESRSEINIKELAELINTRGSDPDISAAIQDAYENGMITINGEEYIVMTLDPELTGRNLSAVTYNGHLGGETNIRQLDKNSVFSGTITTITEDKAIVRSISRNRYSGKITEVDKSSINPALTASNSLYGNPNIVYNRGYKFQGAIKASPVGVFRRDEFRQLTANYNPTAAAIVKFSNVLDRLENTMKNILNHKREKELVCSITVVGKPTLVYNRNIDLLNISRKYSGTWHIREVVHTLDVKQGYTTSADLTFVKAKDPIVK